MREKDLSVSCFLRVNSRATENSNCFNYGMDFIFLVFIEVKTTLGRQQSSHEPLQQTSEKLSSVTFVSIKSLTNIL